jgi:hypothetical protein
LGHNSSPYTILSISCSLVNKKTISQAKGGLFGLYSETGRRYTCSVAGQGKEYTGLITSQRDMNMVDVATLE